MERTGAIFSLQHGRLTPAFRKTLIPQGARHYITSEGSAIRDSLSHDNGDGVSAESVSLQVNAIPQSAIEFAVLSAYHPAAVALFFAESHRPKHRTSSRRGGRSLARGQSLD